VKAVWLERFVEMVGFESGMKRLGVMDGDSGDDGRDENQIKSQILHVIQN